MLSDSPSLAVGSARSVDQYDQLYSAGVVVDETLWSNAPASVKELVQRFLDFTGTIPPDCWLTRYYQTVGAHYRIACVSSDRTLVERIYYDRSRRLDEAIVDMRHKHESTWIRPVSVALACFLDHKDDFSYLRETVFDSIAHPLTPAAYLDKPNPSFTVGFRCAEIPKTSPMPKRRKPLENAKISNADTFDCTVIQEMKLQAGSGFMPHVNEAHLEIIFPFFCFQVEQHDTLKQVAVDRLGRALSFALGLLKQLRVQAKDRCKLPIMVFGATSIGGLWTLYVAYEPEPFYYGISCEICTIWTSNVDVEDDGQSVEFLWLVERIAKWSRDVLRPQIQTWLIAKNKLSAHLVSVPDNESK